MNRLLRVNLTTGPILTEEIDARIAKDYIGGLGIGVKYLYDEVDPNAEPLSPHNRVSFTTGPLTGTRAPPASRYLVVTKAHSTGTIANSSSAGFVGPELRFRACDRLMFEAESTIPVYLWDRQSKEDLLSA